MPKRLHELLIHSFIRATETILVCDSGDLCGGTQHTHRASALARYLVSCHARPNP